MKGRNKNINKEQEKAIRKIDKIRSKYLKKILDIRGKATSIAIKMQRELFKAGASYPLVSDIIDEYRVTLFACLYVNDEMDVDTIGESTAEMIMQENKTTIT